MSEADNKGGCVVIATHPLFRFSLHSEQSEESHILYVLEILHYVQDDIITFLIRPLSFFTEDGYS